MKKGSVLLFGFILLNVLMINLVASSVAVYDSCCKDKTYAVIDALCSGTSAWGDACQWIDGILPASGCTGGSWIEVYNTNPVAVSCCYDGDCGDPCAWDCNTVHHTCQYTGKTQVTKSPYYSCTSTSYPYLSGTQCCTDATSTTCISATYCPGGSYCMDPTSGCIGCTGGIYPIDSSYPIYTSFPACTSGISYCTILPSGNAGWYATSCPSGYTCSGGTCIATSTCTNGETKCVGNVLQTCSSNIWVTTTTCSGDTPYCADEDGSANCVECTSDETDLCVGETPFCTIGGTCVECLTSIDCIDGEVCNTNTNTCVECVGDENCADGYLCNPSTNTCDENYCDDDGDCETGYVCNTTINACKYDCVANNVMMCDDYTDSLSCSLDFCDKANTPEYCETEADGTLQLDGTTTWLSCVCSWDENNSLCETKTTIETNFCGNGILEPFEDCDTNSLGVSMFSLSPLLSATCSIFDGYTLDANVSCNSDCTYDFSDCYEGSTAVCGNGVPEEGEACDNGAGNDVSVIGNCGVGCVLVSGTTADECGNGALEPGENCEGNYTILTDKSCSNFNHYEDAATISCNNCRLDFSDCYEDPVCGNGVIEGDEECEDWNTLNFDGCNENCMHEEGSNDNNFGSCTRTRMPGDDTCDDDGFLTYGYTTEWTWNTNVFHDTSNPYYLECIDGTETVRCPSDYVRLPFVSWINILVAISLIGFIYSRRR